MRCASLLRLGLFALILSAAVGLSFESANAQTGAADRARVLTTQPPPIAQPGGVTGEGVDQGYAAASPNDTDLGEQAILKRVEKYEPFTLETGVPIYYTSNVALVDRGRMSDVIIAPVVGLTYAPKFQKTLYGEFTLRQQFFYYQDFSSFNFASFDAIAGLAYYMPSFHNLVLRANLDYNRLTPTDDFDDFFSDVSLNLNAELPIRIGRAQQISIGATAAVSLYATPDPPQRNDFGIYVGYSVNLSRSFSLNAAGNIVVRPYDSGGRTDVSEILSFSANYHVRDWLTLSAISTFVANQSNRDIFDYEVFNGGGGITLSFKF
ncbi:MAG TPA: hypothetical protein VH207_15120 [Chthoniobacterales bacterium]|jgi:hypothetical protein|nr:hypothetical protein [Chthoniobacterales bacterium]